MMAAYRSNRESPSHGRENGVKRVPEEALSLRQFLDRPVKNEKGASPGKAGDVASGKFDQEAKFKYETLFSPFPGSIHSPKKHNLFALLVFLLLLAPSFATAEQTAISAYRESAQPRFTKDRVSLQFVSGLIYSPVIQTERPTLNYFQSNLRFGWMFSGIKHDKTWFRGNFEFLMEVTYSNVIKGPGHFMAGLTGLVRYNFVQPDSHFVPYLQMGAGIVYNDIYKDESQELIGQAIEFSPQASFGLHYMVNDHWSMNGELMFYHVSCAGMNDRNIGVNGAGALVGVTYYFDRLWK
jgi:lipid A 3-O-deacylase